MKFLALILSCMIAGSFACDDGHCKDPVLANELMETNFMPNREQLKTLCPKVMTFLECERDFFECSGQSLEELATSSNKIEAKDAKALLSGISLIRDLCDEDSTFHQGYVESIDCFRGFIEPAFKMCGYDALKPIESFFDELYPNEEDINHEVFAEIRCLNDALELACVVDNLGDSCGSVAHRTVMTVLERMKDVLKAKVCGGVENAEDLKSRFLDFLELDDEKRSRIQGVFDLLKRRR